MNLYKEINKIPVHYKEKEQTKKIEMKKETK